ncbi:MAG TPA: AMP-dependent synthetase/ligase [Isosphaeraceae bacterium]|nr:AMP-dependent synthetase/ligase [Isosphaeraceae bacterium]
MAYANLATMHRTTAERLGPRPALRYKRHGLYHDLPWTNYRRQADGAAAALVDLGIQTGDRVGILAENRYEWLIADIAIVSAGGADVPMHAPLSSVQAEYQLFHSGARGVIVSNQAQADKVLAVLDRLPDLEFLVAFDPVETEGRIQTFSWDGIKQIGHRLGEPGLRGVLARERALNRESLATIIYTSGTTGQPKGVMLSHGNLLSNVEAVLAISETHADDIQLSWLPYSHIYARTVDHYMTIMAGELLCLAESINTLVENLAETQPTWMTGVPRFYEKVWASVEHIPKEERKKALQRIFGPRLRQLSSGGAPLPKHVAEGFFEAGILLLQGYGLTETSPVITFNRLASYRLETVGQAIPGVEIKIAPDGEILTRGPHVMLGYWKNPEATRETIVDGWLHTGDVGHLDADGFLTITDRKKDLIITSGGKNIPPSELERLLVSDPYIDQAVVYGDAKPFVSALIVPNFPSLQAKAQELGCTMEVKGDLIESPPVHAFLADRIERLMQSLSQPERVKAFLILARPFQVETEELTATLKLRRRHIIQKYIDSLNALYAEQ